jgi:hypothetical protein
MSQTTRTAIDRGESGDRFEAPEEYAGYEVRDPLKRKIGSVEKLFVNYDGEQFALRGIAVPIARGRPTLTSPTVRSGRRVSRSEAVDGQAWALRQEFSARGTGHYDGPRLC